MFTMASLRCLQAEMLDIIPEYNEYVKENLFDVFFLPDDKLVQVRNLLDEEISMRLNPETHHDSPLKFYPSFIEELPDGTESGTYLAVDIGGTHCRVLAVDINKRKTSARVIMEDIPASCHASSGVKNGRMCLQLPTNYVRDCLLVLDPNTNKQSLTSSVFDFIADILHKLLSECGLLNSTAPIQLGFTFSFPVKKIALNKAILIQWTKGFHGDDMIGKDVVQLLEEAIKRKGGMNIQCCAIINDTIGTLMSGAFIDRSCKVGLICGTGTNGCCFEPMDHCVDYRDKVHTTSKAVSKTLLLHVAVDTRWNNFGLDDSIDFIRAHYDHDIRRETMDCPMGIEKMMCGMFIGEVVRRVLLKLHKDNIVLNTWPEQWNNVYSLHTETLSELLRVDKNSILDMNGVLEAQGVNSVTPRECRILHCVCIMVVTRSAHLTAACTSCIVNRVDDPVVGIAVDGSVYKNIELFRDILEQKIKSLLKPGKECYFVPCEDGSGLGAAIVASMVAKKLHSQNN